MFPPKWTGIVVLCCVFTVHVVAAQGPVLLSCPDDIIQRPDSVSDTAIVKWNLEPSANVTCKNENDTHVNSGDEFPVGVTKVTCTHTEGGNCSFTITIDNESPNVTCPNDMTVYVEPSKPDASVVWSPLPSATDDVDPSNPNVTCKNENNQEVSSGERFQNGVNTITCAANDTAGNEGQCLFNITVKDNEPPILSCPNDVIKKPDSGSNTTVNWDPQPSANDTVDGELNVTCQDASGKEVKTGEQYSVGETIVTCKANDSSGNEGSCSFSIKIDNVSPNVACPNGTTVYVEPSRPDAAVVWSPLPSATDEIDPPNPNVTCKNENNQEVSSGDRFWSGVNTITCAANDTAGNEGQCLFNINVADNEGPSVNCSQNVKQNVDPGMPNANVNWTTTPTAFDVVDGDRDPVCRNASGNVVVSPGIYPVGVTEVTCTATDESGNEGNCSFTVTVIDNESPNVTCPGSIEENLDPGMANANVNWTSTPTAFDVVDGELDPECRNALGDIVQSPGIYPAGITAVTCIATDKSGNEGNCSFTVTVKDNEAPNITCPSDRSVNVAEGKTTANLSWVSTAKDVVDGELVASCVPQQGGEFANKTVVTCTATDLAGNNDSCSFTITVTVDGKDCKDHSNCVCGENGKNCFCKENFSGPLCSVLDAAGCSRTNTNCDCRESPCKCNPGFKGRQCNDCEGCMNGGYHQDIATCQCQCLGEGFEAPLCSGCKECVNGGNQNPDTCVCDCPGLYEGDLCDDCPQNAQCENGGTLDNATCSCDCPFPWTGRNCSDCKGCENEGTGQNATTCECVCLEGFLPPLCSDCESCKNGGAFQNDFTCACECPGLWSGLLCNLCPSGNVCENGGEMQRETCSCQCTEEWTGSTCTEPVPTVPDDEYPDPPAGVEIEKRVVFEISVISVGECDLGNGTNSSACVGLVKQFTTEVEKEYERLAGFKQVEINQGDLKKGSVIVPHAAIYDYGKMAPSKRGLSAFDLYRETVATAVASGKLGNLELDRDCMNCAAPKDKTNMCGSEEPTCATGFQFVKEQVGDTCYYVCRAACKVDTDFCQNGGTCSQDADGVKSCRCPQNSEFMYLGVNCQLRVQLLWLYVGCGIGGAVLLFLVVALISCVAIYRKRAKRIEEDDESEEGEMKGEVRAVHHNKGFEGDSASVAEEQVEGETAVPVVETTRPYSYIYSNGGGVGVSRSSSGAAAPGKNRYENSVARDRERETGTGNNDQAEDTSDKARSSYFWGNLAVPSKEDAEMIPMVSAVDPTKMYKIQRPQLSVNRNDDLPERDYF